MHRGSTVRDSAGAIRVQRLWWQARKLKYHLQPNVVHFARAIVLATMKRGERAREQLGTVDLLAEELLSMEPGLWYAR